MSLQTASPSSLALRLKTATAPLHEKLDKLVMSLKPFDNRENYGRFVVAQYLFQRDIESLYDDPAYAALIPDLAERPRLAAAHADLQDLGQAVPEGGETPQGQGMELPEGLGWLYVSEGSKLGAAFLLKEAGQRLGLGEDFGARNLAAPADGRGAAWKRFVLALDGSGLSAVEQDRVVAGASAAFERFAVLLARSYDLKGEPSLA
ncbi:biliverdin-producing heme oxygenase [Pigmentiphaga sp.]|uniref:biliverdin-producing heme oxygenase n=1 Tax=Pigmentiphaga sp. TaxID=1977564 RepID=UPI00128DCD28|nr:biliverdin-producing heme oxygenase [Pigmentiphaga sp.]MPS28489.1 biliverdin-producing heme oxygenase [Alcaligenaceae bacterium SAGV5]MPS52154.1 biliverdin-producing heme oxygenase [Alcaligenaceae bacterium SAGV3]MPT56310.1 biliverdin-producing heme oxygenase [Alcaligenaceae bacterium]